MGQALVKDIIVDPFGDLYLDIVTPDDPVKELGVSQAVVF